MRFTLFIFIFFISLVAPTVNAAGPLTDVRGVSLPSFEWACVQYGQVYDFPLEDTVQVLTNWKLDTVRLPLNQDCWLTDNKYRTEVDKVIETFGDAGFNVIIDLHWNQPPGAKTHEQQVMADAEESISFWKQIATKYKDNSAVIAYELYNEPHSVSWDCWLNGCVTSEGWRTAGMQTLVDTVRSVDTDTWLIVNGLHWANDVIGAIKNKPTDSANKMAFGWHIYDEFDDPNKCVTKACFEEKIAPLAQNNDIVITEFGSRLHCNPSHDEMIMNFAQKNSIGLIAWAWYPADCGFPALIKDWSGTPTAAGSKWCAFLGGDCYKQIVREPVVTIPAPAPVTPSPATPTPTPTPTTPKPVTPHTTTTNLNTTQTLCIVSLKHGVLNSQNTLCTGGQTLEISGASDQTWNNRISSWTTEGQWFAVAGWDYYTTSGRIEKGAELWTLQQSGNVGEHVNDRVRYILMFPSQNGSLTVYEDINKGGPQLKFKLATR